MTDAVEKAPSGKDVALFERLRAASNSSRSLCDGTLSRNAGGGLVQHRPPDMVCEGLQILHDSGEVEFVARAREAAQAHALEAMVGLQVGKAHLDLLALVARFIELGRTDEGTSVIAGIFVEVARDLARRRVWTASWFE